MEELEPDKNCKKCRGSGWILHPDPETRCWIPCECTLPPPIEQAIDILRRFYDYEEDEYDKYIWLRAIDELKDHSNFKG